MIGYVTLGTNDLDRATRFYDALLGEIGARRMMQTERFVMWAVAPDKPAAQQRFDAKFSLGYDLLADTDHAVAEAFGVWQEKALYGKKYMGIVRSAFLIDAQGTIEQAWYKISPADTPKKLLEALGR